MTEKSNKLLKPVFSNPGVMYNLFKVYKLSMDN